MLETVTETTTKSHTFPPYFYDGDGLRIARTDNLAIPPKTTYYVWDTENPTGYPQVLEEIENNQVVRRYGYGLFLETIDIKNGANFDRFYVIRDGTNSVRMLLDSTGNISAQYDYDAFGNILSATNANPLTVGNPFQFHSEYKDPATNLVYLRARWYEPREGRFLCKDEFEGTQENPTTLNKYVSFNNNPMNMTDTNGFQASVMDAMGYTFVVNLMPTARVHIPNADDSEAEYFKYYVQLFYTLSKGKIDFKTLVTLAWSESGIPTGWNKNATNSDGDLGVMQINPTSWPSYATLDDEKSITNSIIILQNFRQYIDKKILDKALSFTNLKTGQVIDITSDALELNDRTKGWYLPIWCYKGRSLQGNRNANDWLEIHSTWPNQLKPKYILLWSQRDKWLEK